MKLLFVGESWIGSSARSMKESLRRVCNPDIDLIDEINEDLYIPRARARWLRAINRLLAPAYRREFKEALISRCCKTKPTALIIYKGSNIDADLIRVVKEMGILTINIFPDYSPHAYGESFQQAIGQYDLVISTKIFHPPLWASMYGYRNRCVFVPHGYDSSIHLLPTYADEFQYDLGLIATWRPEYHALMQQISCLLARDKLRVAIAGNGWPEKARDFPDEWVFVGEVSGLSYVRWAQRSRIVIAPLNREVVINGQRQPGDEDSTRTYELAAANCFFIHRRTNYMQTVYQEHTEVPLFDGPEDLVRLIRHFLSDDLLRAKMAAAAHSRAVPAYSIDCRAKQVLNIVRNFPELNVADNCESEH